jgi:hypothetical protein
MKKLLTILICIVILFSLTSCAKHEIKNIFELSVIDCDIENYNSKIEEIYDAEDFMPSISNLEGYSSIKYSHKRTVGGITFFLPIFTTDVISLTLEYPENVYEVKKAEVLSRYDFITEESYSKHREGEINSPLAEFEYKGFTFKSDINEEFSTCPIKSFLLLGYNDDTHQIVYCYFYDFDRDYLAESDEDPLEKMHELMDEYFYSENFE